MDVQIESLNSYLVNQFVNFILKPIGEEYAWTNLTSAIASWTRLVKTHIHDWSHTLSSDLHQPKFA